VSVDPTPEQVARWDHLADLIGAMTAAPSAPSKLAQALDISPAELQREPPAD
jgi:hypothetical protein